MSDKNFEDSDSSTTRQAYQTPRLSVFGFVRNLTASGSGIKGEGGGKNVDTVKRP